MAQKACTLAAFVVCFHIGRRSWSDSVGPLWFAHPPGLVSWHPLGCSVHELVHELVIPRKLGAARTCAMSLINTLRYSNFIQDEESFASTESRGGGLPR